ncbi:MAG: helix-turn-helix transcriptional regulator [Anaeromyxobacter sp.]
MAGNFDPLRVLEAAYAIEPDDRAWLLAIAEAFAPLARGPGVLAASFKIEAGRMVAGVVAGSGALRAAPVDDIVAFWDASPPEALRAWFEPVPPVDTMLARLRRTRASRDESPARFSDMVGAKDVLAVLGLDPAGNGVHVSLPSPVPVRLSPRAQHRLGLVSAHLAAARRLRAAAGLGAEAVLDPSGRVQHAEGEARAPGAREGLAAAVVRAERARGRLRREEPDAALALWRGLVDGRWSLVDHVEADGRRVILARRNPTGVRDPRALTARERDVLAHVAQGHGNKHVAYALGLSATTVATHLRRALSKLGLRTRRDAIRLFEAAAEGRP